MPASGDYRETTGGRAASTPDGDRDKERLHEGNDDGSDNEQSWFTSLTEQLELSDAARNTERMIIAEPRHEAEMNRTSMAKSKITTEALHRDIDKAVVLTWKFPATEMDLDTSTSLSRDIHASFGADAARPGHSDNVKGRGQETFASERIRRVGQAMLTEGHDIIMDGHRLVYDDIDRGWNLVQRGGLAFVAVAGARQDVNWSKVAVWLTDSRRARGFLLKSSDYKDLLNLVPKHIDILRLGNKPTAWELATAGSIFLASPQSLGEMAKQKVIRDITFAHFTEAQLPKDDTDYRNDQQAVINGLNELEAALLAEVLDLFWHATKLQAFRKDLAEFQF